MHQTSESDEEAVIEGLIRAGDVRQAAARCAHWVLREPLVTSWHRALLSIAEDDRAFGELAGTGELGAQAARAFVLGGREDFGVAFAILAQVVAIAPHKGFQQWATRWLHGAGAGRGLDPTPVAQMLLAGSSFAQGRTRLLPSEVAAAAAYVPLARVASERWPTDHRIALLCSATLRRAGLDAEAVDAARRARPASPELAHIAEGLARRAAGDFDAAIESFREAFGVSGDPVHLIEIFRVFADAGRSSQALECLALAERSRPVEGIVLLERAEVEDALASARPVRLDLVRRRALGHGRMPPWIPGLAPEPHRATAPVADEIARLCRTLVVHEAGAPRPMDFLETWDAVARIGSSVTGTARDWMSACESRAGSDPEANARFQVAALLLVAHSEDGWAGSGRRDVFVGLLRGSRGPLPAAVRVGAEIALHCPPALAEVRAELIALAERLLVAERTSIELLATLAEGLEMLPHAPPSLVGALREQLGVAQATFGRSGVQT